MAHRAYFFCLGRVDGSPAEAAAALARYVVTTSGAAVSAHTQWEDRWASFDLAPTDTPAGNVTVIVHVAGDVLDLAVSEFSSRPGGDRIAGATALVEVNVSGGGDGATTSALYGYLGDVWNAVRFDEVSGFSADELR